MWHIHPLIAKFRTSPRLFQNENLLIAKEMAIRGRRIAGALRACTHWGVRNGWMAIDIAARNSPCESGRRVCFPVVRTSMGSSSTVAENSPNFP